MKNKLFFPCLCVYLIVASCGSNDTLCTDLGSPLVIEFSYVNDEGKNLFAGDSPRFSKDDFVMYEIKNGVKNSISHQFSNDRSKITALLAQATHGEFFVQLEPTLIDTIKFIAIKNEADPCKSLNIDQLTQNDDKVNYDRNSSSWLFKK